MFRLPMTMPERRSRPRTNPNELVYLDMGSENGGIVLNVSEGGLAFCAAFPIGQAEVIQFSLLVKGKGRMRGAGGVAWTDQSGKMCGLRLHSDCADGDERLIRWAIAPYVTTPAPSPAVVAPREVQTPAVTVTAGVSSFLLPAEPLGTNPTPPSPKRELGPFDALTAEDLAATPPGLQLTAATVLGAILVALLVVVLGAGAYSYGTKPEKSRVESSDYAGAQSNPQPKVAAPAAAASLFTQEGGEPELEAALEYLRAPDGQRDATSATRLLQAAVKSGNSPAGVFLAEMYLSGDGIRKNCTDARALLTAASRKGNMEASMKLKELVARGCR